MKQRLNNIRQSKYFMIIAVAIVAAILVAMIALINFIRTRYQIKQLSMFKEEVMASADRFIKSNTIQAISESSESASESEYSENADNSDFKSLRQIKEELNGFESEYTNIINNPDIYSVAYGSVQGGEEVLNNFIRNTETSTKTSMIMAQFTPNLDPVYYYLEYNGDRYHIVVDQTRDGYDNEYGYVEVFGQYLKYENYELADGSVMKYGYLTDNQDMIYPQLITYLAEAANGEVAYEMPQLWQFLMLADNASD